MSIYKNTNYVENVDNNILVPILEPKQLYECKYKNVVIFVNEDRSDADYVAFRTKEVIKNKTLNVEFITDDPTFVTQTVDDLYSYTMNDYKQVESEFLSHYVFADYHEWVKSDSYYKRNLNTLYLPEQTKKNLFEDVTNFYNNEEIGAFYKKLNIPQSRVYLLYGYPGTGKQPPSP